MADKNVELYYMHRPVADLTALAAVDATNTVAGTFFVTADQGTFEYDPNSLLTPDGRNIIAPSAGGGNFIRTGMFLFKITAGGKIDSSILDTPFSMALGGTGAALTPNLGGIIYSTNTTMAVLASTDETNRLLMSGLSDVPFWSTAQYPSTTVANQILYSTSNNLVQGITSAASSILITDGNSIPSWGKALPQMTGTVVTTDATQSTSATTGSFVTAGGLGVEKDAYFGANLNVTTRITTPDITISNDPTNPTDGANKAYVDAHGSGSNYWTLSGGVTLNPVTSTWNVVTTGRLGAVQGTITGAVVNPTDIATKAYVDGSVASGYWTRVGNTLYPNDTTWNILTTGNITVHQGTLSVDPTTPMQIATKNYVDTHSTPGTGYWNYAAGALTPDDASWAVVAGYSYRIGESTDNAELVLVQSPITDAPAQSLLYNGIYVPGSNSYTFRYNADSSTVTGHVLLGSMGGTYDYAYLKTSATADQTITATNLYTLPLFVENNSPTFFAYLDSSADADYSIGTATGTLRNSATIANGRADLTGSAKKCIQWSATGNANFTQKGTISFVYIPNYEGTPSNYMSMVCLRVADTSLVNMIELSHNIDGKLYLSVYSSTGTGILTAEDFGAWSPRLLLPYNIEVDIDITTGATRLFLNGLQKGATKTQTGTRTNTCAELLIGMSYYESTYPVTSDFYMMNLAIDNEVLHTTNFSPANDYYRTNLKSQYDVVSDSYTYYSKTNSYNACFGNPNSVGTYSSCISELSRESDALFPVVAYGMGTQTVPVWVFNGVYNPAHDAFTFRSDGTTASGLVLTRNTGVDKPNVLTAYVVSQASATDYSTTPFGLLSLDSFSIRNDGIMTIKNIATSISDNIVAGDGPLQTDAHLLDEFSTIHVITTAAHTNDSVMLPQYLNGTTPIGAKGRMIRIYNYSGLDLFVWSNFGEKLMGAADTAIQLTSTSHVDLFLRDTSGANAGWYI
jgi:hypothetical protein